MLKTRFDVKITLTDKVDIRELRQDLKPYKTEISRTRRGAIISTTIDITEPTIEHILMVCRKYSDKDVKVKIV